MLETCALVAENCRDTVHMQTPSSKQKHWEAVLLWMYMHNPKIPAWRVLEFGAFSGLSVLRQSVLRDPIQTCSSSTKKSTRSLPVQRGLLESHFPFRQVILSRPLVDTSSVLPERAPSHRKVTEEPDRIIASHGTFPACSPSCVKHFPPGITGATQGSVGENKTVLQLDEKEEI